MADVMGEVLLPRQRLLYPRMALIQGVDQRHVFVGVVGKGDWLQCFIAGFQTAAFQMLRQAAKRFTDTPCGAADIQA